MQRRKGNLLIKGKESKEYMSKYPNRRICQNRVHYAVKIGKLIRGECALKDKFCSKIIQAHHENYDKPLEVIWLCASHHKKVDLGIINLSQEKGKVKNKNYESKN